MPGVTIRPCRDEECEEVLDLWREADATVSPTDALAEVRRLIGEPQSLLLVAEEGGGIIGTIIGGWDGWRGNIYRLAVRPAARRRGVARALVEETLRRLAAMGARRITALVEHDHARAVAFWDSLRDLGCERDPRMMRYVLTPRSVA